MEVDFKLPLIGDLRFLIVKMLLLKLAMRIIQGDKI